jgi:hypothetical protein
MPSSMRRLPLYPKNPERICWGCDKYCPENDLACGNGTIRTPHPAELFGADWVEFFEERAAATADSDARPAGAQAG